MGNSPCMNCTNRKILCHDDCPAYLKFHEKVERAREQRRNAIAANPLRTSRFQNPWNQYATD